jgi:hypothetical protein
MLIKIVSVYVEDDVCVLSRAVDVDSTGFSGEFLFKRVCRKMFTVPYATTWPYVYNPTSL